MKKELHPNYIETKITCVTCGNEFVSRSTTSEIKVDTCSNCHPFYTGKATSSSKAGRVDRFNTRLNKKTSK